MFRPLLEKKSKKSENFLTTEGHLNTDAPLNLKEHMIEPFDSQPNLKIKAKTMDVAASKISV
jgi:hypothetical protein